jgi:hypothetical protein
MLSPESGDVGRAARLVITQIFYVPKEALLRRRGDG